LKTAYFPIHTYVSKTPVTICEKLPAEVFGYPFFNDAIPLVRTENSLKNELDLNTENTLKNKQLLQIKGFIFHTSHCGSTLLSNMFKASKKTRVISETEAINGLLLSAVFYNLEERSLLKSLKTIMEAYLKPLGEATQVVFKLTSWNIFFIEIFKKAFPHVPWIFINRKTEEVVASLSKSGRGFVEWFHNPNNLLQNHFLGDKKQAESVEKYLLAMVEAHKRAAEKCRYGNDLFVEYPSFLNEFKSKILPHFNLKYSEMELQATEEIKKYDSKSFQNKAIFAKE
tara:strand:+ start:1804 stop:2655 length:852 start_codon:yes stop_codon:yes gene_type:complete